MELCFWVIIMAVIAMGGTCSLAGTWWDKNWRMERKKKKEEEKRR